MCMCKPWEVEREGEGASGWEGEKKMEREKE
jgi:hypothetical protein